MDAPEMQIYRFDNIEVDLSRECLVRDGQEKHLRQKAFQVLVYLLERRERLVSKAELFDAVWANTAVTDDVLVQCVTEIRRVIGDDPHRPRFIKTVPKSGYRFIGAVDPPAGGVSFEEVTTVEIEVEEETETRGRPDGAAAARTGLWRWRPTSRLVFTAALMLVMATAGLAYLAWGRSSQTTAARLPQIAGRKTVAVMFFENQSGSPELEWLCEGLADMFAAGLSRSDKLNVLGRGELHTLISRLAPGGRVLSSEDAVNVARHAQAEVFITGSFAQIGERVRLDVRLYEAANGTVQATETLTVEKADRLLTEIDLLSLKISNRLSSPPSAGQDMASVMTDDLEAYRFYSLGVEKAQGLQSTEAIKLLERAIEIDPDFAMAHARIGYTYAVTWAQNEKGKPYLEKAFQLSSRLTEKDRLNIAAWYYIANLDFAAAIGSYRDIINRYPFETEAYWRLARLLKGEEKPDDAIDVLRRGLTIDPESKDLYNVLGSILSGKGDHAGAIAAHERYVALAPAEPNAYDSLGLSLQWSGDYKRAIANYERALELDPHFEIALTHLANTHLRMGHYDRAAGLFQQYADAAPSDVEKARGLAAIAGIHLRLDDLDTAEKYAVQAGHVRRETVWNLYQIALTRGQVQRATQLEQQVLANLPTRDRGARTNGRFEPYYRGTIALENGSADAALSFFRQALPAPAPVWNDMDFEDCLGSTLLRLDRFDEAIAEYERILRLSPNYPLAHFQIAEAYRQRGSPDDARRYYHMFLEAWPDADDNIPQIVAARKFIS